MKFIDFAISFRVLSFPHPLFADDVDFEGVGWRPLLVKIKIGPPGIEADHEQKWNCDPGNFDGDFGETRFTAIGLFATAIFEQEIDHRQQDEQDHRGAEGDEREIKVVHLMREGS